MTGAGRPAVFLDVGGTLWPERWPHPEEEDAVRAVRLRAILPALSPTQAQEAVRRLHAAAVALEHEQLQDIDALVRGALRDSGLPPATVMPDTIRKAMCLPAHGRIELFAGARELLETIRALGVSCVVITNAVWRDGDDYARDFADFGIGALIAASISSVDAGMRKPHRGIFDAALAAARTTATRSIMIGNSERNDVQAALALGMQTLRVAIEEPRPTVSAAYAVVTSLFEAADIVRTWATLA